MAGEALAAYLALEWPLMLYGASECPSASTGESEMKCVVCGKELPEDYEPVYCCDGTECGCMGLPVEPPLCSAECENKVFGLIDKQYPKEKGDH